MRLFARLRAFLRPDGHLLAPLAARVLALEARLSELDEVQTHRELQWAEMNAQLRRYLGRLDAHAGRDRERSSSSSPNGVHRPDVIAAKFPGGLPTKE
jgi:hypothetical protein